MNARVRGIYATALTHLFVDAGHEVVDASAPVRERFGGDHDLSAEARPAVRVESTDDRRGLRVVGDEGAVATAADLASEEALDALAWPADAPLDAVREARVVDTTGDCAVCDLGDAEGCLPFDRVDEYVESGDAVRVQVADPAPPWADRRPTLDGTVRVRGPLVTLIRGRDGSRVDAGGADARELLGLLDVADLDPPTGWGAEWHRPALDAGVDRLRAALDGAADRALAVDDALAADEAVDGLTTRFVWLGRDARFALDDRRAAVATTMPGHHRTKASSASASLGVDLAESCCADLGDAFPFDAVTRQLGPVEGDEVALEHGKPDGSRVTLGRGEVIERDPDGSLAVRRELTAGGTYDALGVEREAGDTATTRVREGRWWYPTVYRSAADERKGTYVNVCTPVECFPDAVRYVDLHVDVVKGPDGRVERVDDDELDAAVAAGHVSPALADRAREVAASVERALAA